MDTIEHRRPRARVLVIEDDARIRDLFCEWLEALGCDVTGVEGGEQGLRRFEDGGCDLVVTDLMMPGLTGWQVIAALRRRDPAVPVIMITGSAMNIEPAHLQASGVTLLEKPISLVGFKTVVTATLDVRMRAAATQTSGS